MNKAQLSKLREDETTGARTKICVKSRGSLELIPVETEFAESTVKSLKGNKLDSLELIKTLEKVSDGGNISPAEVTVIFADPDVPTEIGFYDTSGYARGVAVSGNYAYIADGYEFLQLRLCLGRLCPVMDLASLADDIYGSR
ncbi:MAG: hypothetical protein ABFS37_04815, partial [Acidobacteriota bacterium]